MSPLNGRIIDVWMQHPTPCLGSEPMFESLRRWVPSTKLGSSGSVPLATTIQAMDAAGVALGLVCAWWGPHGPLIDNEDVAAFIRERPDRLIGVASVDLGRPMAAVRELRRAVRELGFRALRILPWLWNLPPDDRRYYPLYAECIELDIPFCLQVGHNLRAVRCARTRTIAIRRQTHPYNLYHREVGVQDVPLSGRRLGGHVFHVLGNLFAGQQKSDWLFGNDVR